MTLHASKLSRIVPTSAAYGLIAASAGFGGLFAYKIGIEHSLELAILTVVFAVSLELLKPVAIVSAIQAAQSWQPIRSLLLAILGTVAIAYSLTSELALVSGSRSDLTARRGSEAFQSQAAKDAYKTAKVELDYLVADQIKPKSQKELQAIMAKAVAQSGSSVGLADPASEALRVYAGAVGYNWKPETISQWMLLVPILALEIGSALSLVLLNQLKEPVMNHSGMRVQILEPVATPAQRILDHLHIHGGSLNQSERELARKLGLDRNAARRAMLELSSAKLISHQPTSKGTKLNLIGNFLVEDRQPARQRSFPASASHHQAPSVL